MKKTTSGLWDLNLSHWFLSRHSQNHKNSPVEGRESVSTHSLTHCYCSTGTLFQSLKMFHQPCFLQKPQSRRDLWHLRMRLNLCFSKLLKMRSHNITERGERHRVPLMEKMKGAFLSLPSSTPGKPETNQEHREGNTKGQVSICVLQLCEAAQVPPSLCWVMYPAKHPTRCLLRFLLQISPNQAFWNKTNTKQ